MIRGLGCAIRPAPTQKWAAATYLAISTTKKELRRDTTTKNRRHKPQIYTTISPGGVILCTPRDKSMVCQKRPKLSPGCRILWGLLFIMCVRVISCVSYGILLKVLKPSTVTIRGQHYPRSVKKLLKTRFLTILFIVLTYLIRGLVGL